MAGERIRRPPYRLAHGLVSYVNSEEWSWVDGDLLRRGVDVYQLRADRALNVIQSQMLDDIVVEKQIFEARSKAKRVLISELGGEHHNPIPGLIGEDEGYDVGTDIDDPMGQGRRYLGEAQAPTVPLDEGPNPFPMLDQPLG